MHKLTDSAIAIVGGIFGAAGAVAPDTIVQLISAISSLACLAFALVRAAIRTIDAVKKHRRGEKTTEDLLNDLDDIQDDFKKGGGAK